jgi:hypothetical protein
MKIFATVATVALLSSTAYAGKVHREYRKKVAPKIVEATKAIKAACGSSPTFSIDKAYETIKTDHADDVGANFGREAEYIAAMSVKFCNDKDSKALFQKGAKKIILSVTKDAEGDPKTTYKAGTFTIQTTRSGNSAGFRFEEILNEW